MLTKTEFERLKEQKELIEQKQIAAAIKDMNKRCAYIARTLLVVHGDHYGTWLGPAEHAEELAQAIEALIK